VQPVHHLVEQGHFGDQQEGEGRSPTIAQDELAQQVDRHAGMDVQHRPRHTGPNLDEIGNALISVDDVHGSAVTATGLTAN